MIKNADNSAAIEMGVLTDGQCRIDNLETRDKMKVYLKLALGEMITDTPRFIDQYAFFIQEGLTHMNSGIFIY